MLQIPDDRGTAFELAVFKITGTDVTVAHEPHQRDELLRVRAHLMQQPEWNTAAKRAARVK